MSFHTIQPEPSLLDQVSRGFFTGIRWFFCLMVTVVIFATLGTLLHRMGASDSGESENAVEAHLDIRRSIAHGIRGPGVMLASAPTATLVGQWRRLEPSLTLLADDSGFESRVEIRPIANGVDFHVIFGPYDPDISRGFKKSFGWVTLKFLQSNGLPVPGHENGIKIQLSSFEFHQVDGLPVGWIYQGSLGQGYLESAPDISGFELGWVIPSSASTHQSAHIGRR